jgi:hypothetical protein
MPEPDPSRHAADPGEIHIALDGPLRLARGQTTMHALVLTKRSPDPIIVYTDGHLTATIIDDAGTAVGGCAEHQPLVIFTAAAGQTIRVPLLVGTASYLPRLGYTIPAATGYAPPHCTSPDGRHLTTPPLKLTITPPETTPKPRLTSACPERMTSTPAGRTARPGVCLPARIHRLAARASR